MKHFSPTRVHKSQFWPFSTEQGRCFFHCGCMPGTGAIRWGDISFRTRPRRPIEPPILTHRTRDQQTGGTGVMGTEGHGRGRGAGGRQHGQNKHTRPKPHPIGGHRVACGARPRCRRAAAGPGRASRSTTPSRQARVWRSRGRAAAHRHTQRPAPSRQATRRPEIRWRPEHPWGHKQQHAGTNGEWAGRRPPAHTAARPFKAGHTAPGTPVGPQATPEIRRVRKRHRHNGRKETPTAPGTP